MKIEQVTGVSSDMKTKSKPYSGSHKVKLPRNHNNPYSVWKILVFTQRFTVDFKTMVKDVKKLN